MGSYEDGELEELNEKIRQLQRLCDDQARIKELEDDVDYKRLSALCDDQQEKLVDLQRLCDDQADKLRRIAELTFPTDPRTSEYYNLNLAAIWAKGRDAGVCESQKIASSPLGPDWGRMCEKIYEIAKGGFRMDEAEESYNDWVSDVRNWLKEYEAAK